MSLFEVVYNTSLLSTQSDSISGSLLHDQSVEAADMEGNMIEHLVND
jgi:hypothetical protein